jgi:prepilin-type processing-associated H-X9-DG protein
VGDYKDKLPTDGMGDSGDYDGTAPYGTPDDPTAWFNVLPPYWNGKGLSYYYDSKLNWITGVPTPAEPQNYMPFPGRAGSKMWFCPSAQMSDGDLTALASEPYPGYFSYAQPIDLNKEVGTATANPDTVGTTYPFPEMPKLISLPKPAYTVLMFDQLFNPNTESYTQDTKDTAYDSENPGDRFKFVASRHNAGAVLAFCDGHSQYYKDYYITNLCDFGTSVERVAPTGAAVPDIIWNPAFRAALGY